jgi:secreted PhoX family phosphatase
MGVLALAACADNATTAPVARPAAVSFEKNALAFTPLASSVACTSGGTPSAMFSVPGGFVQANIASEPDYLGNPDMMTQNETGPESGRYIFQTHELGLGSNTGVSRTDLFTGQTKMVVQRSDWGSLDGIAWTPWGTVLIGEERTGGKVWEMDPTTFQVTPRPALGLKSHEGSRLDRQGNVYGISETNPGFIFKFTPDTYADLSSGQLYALRITNPTGDRVGDAEWIPLDRAAVQVDANAAAAAAGATGYNRPEDVEIGTSSGDDHGPDDILYVAVTGPSNPVDNRVIAIDLHEARGSNNRSTAFVYDYVKWGLNVAQADFEMPDNVALDRDGTLFITEDPATAPNTKRGDDIWVARPPTGKPHQPAVSVERFASLTDCSAEPTGIYVDLRSNPLFVHAQHRGGDGLDKTVAVFRP